MKLAVCLYKYFAYGGLARDFRRILEIRRAAGDEIDVYYIEWDGDPIPGFKQIPVGVSGLTNHARVRQFYTKSRPLIEAGNYDLVIGFNKMPGLDLYYAADPCYLARVSQEPSYIIKRLFGRVKFYEGWERAVFGLQSHTVSMMISSVQRKLFEHYYQTPPNRLVDLPPGIDPERVRPDNWQQQRQQFRQQLSLDEEDFLLLMIGSGFKRKGADFAIEAIAALPAKLRVKTHLYIVGEDTAKPFELLAKKHYINERTHFMGGRDDVAKWLLAADVFLHPARSENTGTVILEAMVAGLPSMVSRACGYANYIEESQAGECITQPENIHIFSQQLAKMLDKQRLKQLSQNALDYAATRDLYSMPQRAAELIETLGKQKPSF